MNDLLCALCVCRIAERSLELEVNHLSATTIAIANQKGGVCDAPGALVAVLHMSPVLRRRHTQASFEQPHEHHIVLITAQGCNLSDSQFSMLQIVPGGIHAGSQQILIAADAKPLPVQLVEIRQAQPSQAQRRISRDWRTGQPAACSFARREHHAPSACGWCIHRTA